MRTPFIVAAFAVSLAAQVGAQDTLQILRHTPSDTAGPGNVITVTFDRPVFGNIEQAIPAASVFSISPALPGRIEWRDPITLRFIPERPFVPGQEISVRISDTLRAIDGSRMPAPYQFSFRVHGPRLLSRSFDGQRTLPPNGKIELTYSAPIDQQRLERNANIGYTCNDSSKGTLPLHITGQRRVPPGTYYYMYSLWGAPSDTSATRFFRVVELTPSSSPPLGCALRISLPTTDDDSSFGRVEIYKHRSANHFTLAELDCEEIVWCSLGALNVTITSPITDEEATKHISVVGTPSAKVSITRGPPDIWLIAFPQTARSTYSVRVDTAIRDIYGRTLEGTHELRISVGDHKPGLVHPSGLLTVLSSSARTMPIRTMNVSKLRLIVAPIRDAERQSVLASIAYDQSSGTSSQAETTFVTVPARLNVDTKIEVPLPPMVFRPNGQIVRARFEVAAIDSAAHPHREHLAETIGVTNGGFATILQATDLAMTLKIGLAEAIVHVTSASDARPRGGVVVSDIDPSGHIVAQATTDASGIARLSASIKQAALRSSLASADRFPPVGHLVEATLGNDRLTMPLGFRAIGYRDRNILATEDLGGRRESLPAATVAIFTDRPIYRPGERVFIKAVARSGVAGELRVPTSGDSIRLILRQPNHWPDDPPPLRDSVVALGPFGTYTDSIVLPKTLPLGEYTAEVAYAATNGRVSGTTRFTLAEYRAPEFSVAVKVDSQYSNKDTLAFIVSGDYFLGSPMRGAATKWELTSSPSQYWEPAFPDADDWWFGDGNSPQGIPGRVGQGSVVLDGHGRATVKFGITNVPKTRPTEFTLTAFVTDANRQQMTASNSTIVLRSRRHIGMHPDSGVRSPIVGNSFNAQMKVVDDSGKWIPNVRVIATATRRRWMRSDGKSQLADTVIARDTLVSRDRPVDYAFKSDSIGNYVFRFAPLEATDEISAASIQHFVRDRAPVVSGGSPYVLPLIADRQHLEIGDTARIRFVCPFDSASAWVTTEREGLISSRLVSVHRGNNTLDIPVESNSVPNVWVSVSIIARRPDAARLDSASDRLRAGYVEIFVDASKKQLTVALSPDKREYVPGSTASITLDVRDAAGRGTRSEVALWAVDEGLLAMMPYSIPDLFDRFYRARGLTFELKSTVPAIMTNNAAARLSLQASLAQLQEVVTTNLGNSVSRERPSTTVRRNFRSTAFFLGNIITDATGRATAHPRLPDNLTTFRVIAVAVDSSNRFGTGTDSIVVSLPLAARAALPRFVRPSDSLLAGAVITSRDTLSRRIDVATSTVGLSTLGPSRQTVDFKHGIGVEARFNYIVPGRNAVRDTVKIQLSATDGKDEDASETLLPVKPDFTPRAHTIIGSARGSADVVFSLPSGIDPAKSRVSLRIGTTPLAPMLAAYDRLRVYPYYCTEQISSMGRAMVAIWKATRHRPHPAFAESPLPALQQLVDEISMRQNGDGSIGYWHDFPWTTPWLTAYAGLFLLDARDVGASVDTMVVHRLTKYMSAITGLPIPSAGENRFEQRSRRLALGYRVAAVDLLRRIGSPNAAAEDALLTINTRMTWEDRLRLAEVVAKRTEKQTEARAIIDDSWKPIVTAGNRVDLPDTANPARDFASRIAPAARLLTATLALEPDRPLIGGLIETVLQQSRAEGAWTWSTQDYASAVLALAAFTDTVSPNSRVRLVGRRGTLANTEDSTVKVPLTDLLEKDASGRPRLALRVESTDSNRVFYAVQVDEVPLEAPTRPDIKGVLVERWYERYSDGKPVTSIEEGEIVRVRLRVTVPANRQFVALEDPLPSGLEAIDFNLRTSAHIEQSDAPVTDQRESSPWQAWLYGSWIDGGWSPWEHRELRDDRVVYFARVLWPGTYDASYVARATTSGNFVRPPAHAEEMYNPALQGRSDGGRFAVTRKN